MPTDDGTPVLVISPTWTGDIADGYVRMQDFAELATPLTVDFSVMLPLAKLRQLDGMLPDGALYAIGTRNISSLTPAEASTIFQAYEALRTYGTFLNIHHYHGRAAGRAVENTPTGSVPTTPRKSTPPTVRIHHDFSVSNAVSILMTHLRQLHCQPEAPSRSQGSRVGTQSCTYKSVDAENVAHDSIV